MHYPSCINLMVSEVTCKYLVQHISCSNYLREDDMEKRPVGRPIEGEEAKRLPLSLRTTPRIRYAIEQAAESSGRSLAQEMEHRLEDSVNSDVNFGGAHNNAFFRMMTTVVQAIEERNGAKWTDDLDTYWAVREALNLILKQNSPAPDEPVKAYFTAESARIEAEKLYREARSTYKLKQNEIEGAGGFNSFSQPKTLTENQRMALALYRDSEDSARAALDKAEALEAELDLPFTQRLDRARDIGLGAGENAFRIYGRKPARPSRGAKV